MVGSAFTQFYARLSLSLLVRGIKLPWAERMRGRQSPELQAAIARRLLVREIRGERFTVRKGPMWARALTEKLVNVIQRNTVWLMVALKLAVAFLLVVLPTGVFIFLRGSLPVPERIVDRSPQLTFSAQSNLRTDWLYTEQPFQNLNSGQANRLKPGMTRGVSVTEVLEPNAPSGLYHLGIGQYPRRVELLRGFVASENAPLTIAKQRDLKIDFAGRNRLRLKYYLFPKSGQQSWCRIQVRDGADQLLLSTEHATPSLSTDKNDLADLFRLRFTPDTFSAVDEIKELTIETDVPPSELKVQISLVAEEQSVQDKKADAELGASGTSRDVSEDSCIFAIGDLSYEWESVEPLPRRGVVVVVVDTLRNDVTLSRELMPQWNAFAEEHAARFVQHRSQSNMTVPSMTSLMFSKYPREVANVSFLYAFPEHIRKSFHSQNHMSLARLSREKGYRSAALGSVSLFTEALEGGIDFGFHEAVVLENPQYETRNITEEALAWLERNAEAPFVLYLHYHTMHGPYRPPLEYIHVLDFLKKPFGLNGQQELYKGLARYFDNELGLLTQKLHDLGLLQSIDMIVTSDHGVQMDPQPYGFLGGIESDLYASNADKGHTITDEEVHVPLLLKVANSSLAGETISKVSAHIDLLPSLTNLLSKKTETSPSYRGTSWFQTEMPFSAGTIETSLRQRDHILFEAHRYSGGLFYGAQYSPALKYVRQLEPDNAMLYRSKWPRRDRERWFEAESFAVVDLERQQETWLATVPSQLLGNLRRDYFRASQSPKVIQFQFPYEGNLDFSIVSKGPELENEDVPAGLKFERTMRDGNTVSRYFGSVKAEETLSLVWNGAKILNFETPQQNINWVACSTSANWQVSNLIAALSDSNCVYYPPQLSVVRMNYSQNDFPVMVKSALKWDRAVNIEFSGAGEALRNALRDWGYAK